MKYIDLTELLVPTGGIEIDLAREGVPEQGGPASAFPPSVPDQVWVSTVGGTDYWVSTVGGTDYWVSTSS